MKIASWWSRRPGGRRRDTRTHVVAVTAWVAGTAGLATALYPTLAASLFAFLAGLVVVVAMRASPRTGVAVAALAMAPFAYADLALSVLAADPDAGALGPGALLAHPAAHQLDVVAYLLLGVVLLLASAAVADTASAVIGRLPEEERAADRTLCLPQVVELSEREPGLRRAQWEVARAAEYRRPLAVALAGIDPPLAGDEPSERRALMGRLDGLILDSVTRFDVVVHYGPRERLMVLLEESAESLDGDAAQLCARATERLGPQVRMALAGVPTHGTSLPELLSELEVGLATCRIGGTAVQLGRAPAPPAVALPGPSELLAGHTGAAPSTPAPLPSDQQFA